MDLNGAPRTARKVALRIARALADERQWWRDARAVRREYLTLGCRSNAELDRLPD